MESTSLARRATRIFPMTEFSDRATVKANRRNWIAARRSMRATLLVRPDGRMRTGSPGCTVPASISPAKPRKSRSGRLTHCTAMRKGRAASAS